MAYHTLMFGWEFPPKHLGGLGVACQGLVRGLLKRGAKVTLVLPHAESEQEEGLSILSPDEALKNAIRVRSTLQPYDHPEAYAARKAARGNDPLYAEDLGAAVQEFTELAVDLTKHTHPDVIHSHDWMTFGAGAKAAAYHRKPFIAQVHATELDRTHFKPNTWIYHQERRGLHAADHIISVSNYTKNLLVKEYGIRAEKIDVVHNAVSSVPPLTSTSTFAPTNRGFGGQASRPQHPTSLFELRGAGFYTPLRSSSFRLRSSPPDRRAALPAGRQGFAGQVAGQASSPEHHPLVLFIGRLTVQKGPFHFLEAARIVHRHNKYARFIIAGEGYLLPELIDRSFAMDLADSVLFAGKVSSDEVRALNRQASCFVMPSTSEPFGLVALEAIAEGTPVILSKQSGVREVAPHAFHVDFWDIEKLADCILTVLREEPLAIQLRSQATNALHHLTWENQAEKVLSVYDKVRLHY